MCWLPTFTYLNSSLLPTCTGTLICVFTFRQKVSTGDISLPGKKDIKTLCSTHEMVCALPPFSHMLGPLYSGTFCTPSLSRASRALRCGSCYCRTMYGGQCCLFQGVIYANWPTQSTASSFSKKLTLISPGGCEATQWRTDRACTP